MASTPGLLRNGAVGFIVGSSDWLGLVGVYFEGVIIAVRAVGEKLGWH